MQKILITSNGFDYYKIVGAAIEFLDGKKPKAMAFINEGFVPMVDVDHSWIVEELERLSLVFDCEIFFTNLSSQGYDVLKELFLKVDFIFINGGNADYLYKVMQDSKCIKLFEELPNKPIIASSSGGFFFGKKLTNHAYRYFYDDIEYDDVKEFYNLFNFAYLTHFERSDFPRFSKQNVTSFSALVETPIVCLNDTQALRYESGSFTTIGGSPYCVYKGNEISFNQVLEMNEHVS